MCEMILKNGGRTVNANICRKCNNYLKIFFADFPNVYLECYNKINERIFTQEIPNEFKEKIAEDYRCGIRYPALLSCFSKLEPNKECPFYFEHKILSEEKL